MKTYTVAHLGCGHRGSEQVLAIAAAGPRLKLVALCDLDEAKRRDLAARVSGEPRLYDNAAAMLAAERPDIFSFTTPPAIRVDLVRLGVEAGCKAIVMEKPMALSLDEAQEICRITNQQGIKLIVSHQHKYGPHWQKVKEVVAHGEIGQVRTIHATSLGWMSEYATHLIDYVMWLNDYSPAVRVVGHVHGRDWLGDEESHPAPGFFLGHIEFANGVRGIIECGTFAPEQEPGVTFWFNAGVTVVGTAGVARVIVGKGWEVTTGAGVFADPKPIWDVKDTIPLHLELADWLDDPAKLHMCRAELAYHGFEVMTAICLSALDHKVVTLPLQSKDNIIDRMRAEIPCD